jgi:DUF1365 family protein
VTGRRKHRAEPELPCLYDVSIGHSRRGTVEHSFRNRSFMWLYDLAAPPRLPRLLRPLARFRAADHVDIPDVLAGHGIRAERILVLTNPRVLGYVFNPISVYWCYDAGGRLLANVAEVHNTYKGRHAYVLPVDERPGEAMNETVVDKAMYVSPFYPVDGSYRIKVSAPTATVSVSVVLERPGDQPFRAGLSGQRRPANAANIVRNSIRYPAAPLRGRALIQWQGLRLWRRGLEVQPR